MKLGSALMFLIGTAFPLAAQPSIAEQDELSTILELIEVSKKNLVEQQKILKALVEFRKSKEAFIQEPTSPKLATQLVKNASRVLRGIESSELAYLFTAEFLAELRFFDNVGKQHSLKE